MTRAVVCHIVCVIDKQTIWSDHQVISSLIKHMMEGSMKQASPARASRLRQRHEGKGHTLEEASGVSGLSPTYLSAAERGTCGLRPDAKVEMSRRLGVQVGDLVDVEPWLKRS